MKVDGRHFRSIWLEPDGWSVGAIDQRRLPHEFVIARLDQRGGGRSRRHPHHAGARRAADRRHRRLWRGAGDARRSLPMPALDRAYKMLIATRPTAINLKWALDEMQRVLRPLPPSARASRRPTSVPPKSPKKMSRSTGISAGTAWR